MTTEPGLAARVARLERALSEHDQLITRLDDAVERVLRENRQLRPIVAVLEERERWVDRYRAEDDPDRNPFAALGRPIPARR